MSCSYAARVHLFHRSLNMAGGVLWISSVWFVSSDHGTHACALL